MKILAIAAATLAVLVDLALWAACFMSGWEAAAPHHTVEANRGWLLAVFAFFGFFAALGAVAWAITEVDR